MKIIVFSGAGISRESGLTTFRDHGGLWEGHDVREVASIQGWWEDPGKVLNFYNWRRREALKAEPNAAHLALAELERDHEVHIITQNVDDLHERAGSQNVLHLHGKLLEARPTDDELVQHAIPWLEDLNLGDTDERGVQLRPNIVWFGEGLPELPRAMEIGLANEVDILIVVGTTLEVYPAAMIATESSAKRVYLVDPAPPKLQLRGLTRIAEPATIGIRQVVDEILRA